jgi:hypothetical protein
MESISLITGSLLALLGVLVAQLVSMIQARLERKERHREFQRAKLEELGFFFIASMSLPNNLMECRTQDDIQKLTLQKDGNSAYLLATMHFPEIEPLALAYINSYAELCYVSSSLFLEGAHPPLGEQIHAKPAYKKARDRHMGAREMLLNQIQGTAKLYAES